MSVITGTSAKIIRQRGVLVIAILIITTVAIITGVILGDLLSTQDAFKADLITVVENLIIPVPWVILGLLRLTENTRMMHFAWKGFDYVHSHYYRSKLHKDSVHNVDNSNTRLN